MQVQWLIKEPFQTGDIRSQVLTKVHVFWRLICRNKKLHLTSQRLFVVLFIVKNHYHTKYIYIYIYLKGIWSASTGNICERSWNLQPDRFSIAFPTTWTVFCKGTLESWNRSSAKTRRRILRGSTEFSLSRTWPTRCRIDGSRANHP